MSKHPLAAIQEQGLTPIGRSAAIGISRKPDGLPKIVTMWEEAPQKPRKIQDVDAAPALWNILKGRLDKRMQELNQLLSDPDSPGWSILQEQFIQLLNDCTRLPVRKNAIFWKMVAMRLYNFRLNRNGRAQISALCRSIAKNIRMLGGDSPSLHAILRKLENISVQSAKVRSSTLSKRARRGRMK